MAAPIQSILTRGAGGIVVDAECHISNGLPSIVVVGLGNKAINEARERIRSALASSNIRLPRKRITINLAPADIPKESSSLDLPIALSILQAGGQIKSCLGQDAAAIGELGLDGSIRSVRGIIGKLLVGRQHDIRTFFIPQGNLQQALLVPGIKIIAAAHILDFYLGLNDERPMPVTETEDGVLPADLSLPPAFDHVFSDITGQAQAKRALVVAAAGGHNVLLTGPPGTGKSMLAKALPSVLPPLTMEEVLEITHLYSLAGNDYEQLVVSRPFRSPHHTASQVAVIGGGAGLRPGDVTLSHRGVLFLDELPEFDRATIEALRQPLEDRTITIARAKDTAQYPANFILIATANPCPCGYYGSPRPCDCPPHRIIQYQHKLSGPIMDRFDLHVTVEPIEHRQLLQTTPNTDADEALRQAVCLAREVQASRFLHTGAPRLNADMSNTEVKTLCKLEATAQTILDGAAERLQLSARGYMRTVKVARTIADLDGRAAVEPEHMAEALQYRPRTINTA